MRFLLLSLLLAVTSPVLTQAQPTTNCDNLPGIWRGFSGFSPLGERYTFSWNTSTSSPLQDIFTFNIINNAPGSGEWTYAFGELLNGNTSASIYFPQPNVWLTGPLSYNCSYLEWNNTSEWAKDEPIQRVHVVFASHLDVGFTALIIPSLNQYFGEYYPRAYSLIEALKNTSTPFMYMTHPWLLDLYFHCPANFTLSNITLICPSEADQTSMRGYLQSGDIFFHAAPFNVEYEMVYSQTMGEINFQLAQDLADELNIPSPRTASVRDVPGITRGAVPLFAAAGISAISEGVNGLTSPPDVVNPSMWLDPVSGAKVMYVQHSFGYGSTGKATASASAATPKRDTPFQRHLLGDSICSIVPGFPSTLCFEFRGETQGPPDSIQEIQQVYASFINEFPNATVMASSLQSYMDDLATVADDLLPTFTSEIGDVWLLGGASDPSKVTFYRQSAMAYEECLAQGQCDPSDPRIRNWRTFAIKTPEHTWGMHELSDNTIWKNTDFHNALLTNPAYWLQGSSYIEQRNVSSVYGMQALADHPLATNIVNRMAEWAPVRPSPASLPQFVQVPSNQWGTSISISYTATTTTTDAVVLSFDPVTGALNSLVVQNYTLANATRMLGVLAYQTLNDTDFQAVENCPIAYGRPGEKQAANPNSTYTRVVVDTVYADGGGMVSGPAPRTFLFHSSLPDATLVSDYGGFQEAWINVTVTEEGDVLFDVQLFDKSPTRFGEAIMFEWKPVMDTFSSSSSSQWMMDKIGTWVDPLDVVVNGGILQHAVGKGIAYFDPTSLNATNNIPSSPVLYIDTVDAPIVCPGTPTVPYQVLPTRTQPLPDAVTEWGSMLFSNGWIMNYPLWSLDTDFRFRFAIRVR